MKQRRLERRTPLRAKTQLSQGGGLSSRGPVKPRKPLNWKPSPMTPEEKNARDVVKARSLVGEVRTCEIVIPGVCTGRATDWHHRKNRSQGGTWDPANGLAACHHCHQAVTNTRAEYVDKGWCVKPWDDPLTRPVLRRGEWVLLDDDGGIRPAPEMGEAA